MSLPGFIWRAARATVDERRHEGRKRAFQERAAVPADTCVLVADQGIGDHFLVGAFAAAVQAHHGVLVWLAGHERLGFVAELFPAVRRYLLWPENLRRDALDTGRITGGGFFLAHFPRLELARAVGYRDFHFLDAYRCRLGLPPSAQLSAGRPPSAAELSSARDMLLAQGLPPGRTVILCCEARTTPTTGIGPRFFGELARTLQTHGFEVAVNVPPSGAVPDGLRPLALPLRHFRACVAAAGGVCSVRSGLSDLVADLPCRQAVIYSDTTYWAGPLHVGTTLRPYGYATEPLEVVVSAGDSAAPLRRIAEYFAR